MRPPFQTRLGAGAFCATLLGVLLLPLLVKFVGAPSAEQRLSAVDTEYGAIGRMKYLIYDEPGDTDLLIVGTSTAHLAILPALLEEDLSEALHRNVRVRLLFLNAPGLDASRFLIREYLAHHKVGVVALCTPQGFGFTNVTDAPHSASFAWSSIADPTWLPAALPLRSQAQAYGEQVLGVPRQLLAMVRPNLISVDDDQDQFDNLDADGDQRRVKMAPRLPPPISFGTAVVHPAPVEFFAPTAWTLKFGDRYLEPTALQFGGKKFPSPQVQSAYLRAIQHDVTAVGSKLSLLVLPFNDLATKYVVPEYGDWKADVGAGTSVVGLPTDRLCAGADPKELFRADDFHLNWAGAVRLSHALAGPYYQIFDPERR